MKQVFLTTIIIACCLSYISFFSGCSNTVSAPAATPAGGTAAAQVAAYDLRDAVAYHIVIDRFNDGDTSNDLPTSGVAPQANFMGGDIQGITAKINDGYFTTLGINLLCVSCPFSNVTNSHIFSDGNLRSAYLGEWPIAFDSIDQRFGTTAELKSLVDAAHAKGIRVILEATPRNVESSSTVFTTHSDWFWPSFGVLGTNVAWGDANAYKAGLASYLPPFDFENASSLEYSLSSLAAWFSATGVDGYKVESIAYTESNWLTSFRSRLGSAVDPVDGKHSIVLVDAYGSSARGGYLDTTTKADAGIDWELSYTLADSLLARSSSLSNLDNYISSNIGSNIGMACVTLSPGQGSRPINYAADTPITGSDGWASPTVLGSSAFERMEAAFAIVFTLPGMPYIEYGDEIGMTGQAEPSSYQMMWFGASLSTNQVALHDRVALLASIRAAHSALRNGSYSSLGSTTDTIAYKLSNSSESVIVLVNRSDTLATIVSIPSGSYKDAIGGTTVSGPSVSVPPRSSMILMAN